MKRDMDLVREILLKLEDQTGADDYLEPEQVQGRDPEEVSYHIHLMYEAGLIDAINDRGVGSHWIAMRLTWEGHEFLEASKNLTVWNQAKRIIAEKGGGITFVLIKELLPKLLKNLVLGEATD